MRGRLMSPTTTICLFCLFLIPCIEQARPIRELSLAEGGLQKVPMVMSLLLVCTSAYMTSHLLLLLSISMAVRLSWTEINTPRPFLF